MTELARVTTPLANLHTKPDGRSRLGSQLLFGEIVDVIGGDAEWTHIRARRDGYEGHIRREALCPDQNDASHRVCVPSTFLYPGANIKEQPARPLYLNSDVAVKAFGGEFAELATGGFVFAAHLCAIDQHAPDAVAVAEQFLHVPYLWGGKSFAGIDCSGLVQMSRLASGIASPRDTHQQETAGTLQLPLSVLDRNTERGLLIFWSGHVAITIDATRIIHASGHVMQVVIEDRMAAIARIAEKGGRVSSVQRIQ